MKILRIFSFLWLSLSLVLAACSQRSGTWERIGNLPDALMPPQGTFDLVLGPDDTPYIAYISRLGGNPEIMVVRFVDGEWEEVGGGNVSQNGSISVLPDLAIGPDGNIYVAWADNISGTPQIYVSFFDGFSWSALRDGNSSVQGVSNSAGASLWPSIIVGSDGLPIVAWSEDNLGGTTNILIRRWDGQAWSDMGLSSGSQGGISNADGVATRPYLTLSAGGTPVIAWQDSSGPGIEIYAAQWDGAAWSEISPGSNTGSGLSTNSDVGSDNLAPFLSAGDGDELFVSWANTSVIGDSAIQSAYLLVFDGQSWSEVSIGSARDNGVSGATTDYSAQVAQDGDGNLYMSWAIVAQNNTRVMVQRLVDGQWLVVGEEPPFPVPDKVPASGESPSPQLAVAADGTIYLAWLVLGTNNIEIQRYAP